MNSYDQPLEFAKQLAHDARDIALKYYKTDLAFKTKSDDSPVTIADESINQLVVDRVKEQFPDYGVLGEEQSWQVDKKLLWVCDPIDGTIAFSMGEPTFMFSIALVEDGVPIVAVTADLASGEIFWATKGGGAFRDGQPIHVSKRPLAEAWIALPTRLKTVYASQDLFLRLNAKTYQTNFIHGGVFKGMLVAQGLADAIVYPEDISAWDIAAVKLIVDEAGGSVTNKLGEQQRFDATIPDGAIVSNGTLHKELMDIIDGKD